MANKNAKKTASNIIMNILRGTIATFLFLLCIGCGFGVAGVVFALLGIYFLPIPPLQRLFMKIMPKKRFLRIIIAVVIFVVGCCFIPASETAVPEGTDSTDSVVNEEVTAPSTIEATQETAVEPTVEPTTEPVTETITEPTEPPTTEPLETEPPATEPPETKPPVTEPPATEPQETKPSVTEPPVTEPPETKPAVTEPPATNPPETKPPVGIPPETDPPEKDENEGHKQYYVVNENKSSRRFHDPSCPSADDIKEENRRDYYGTRDELIDQGYVPCKKCHP